MTRTKKQPLRTGGSLWGPRRVALGMSIRDLAAAAGIGRGMISLMENGRLIPRGDEHDRIMAALARAEAEAGVIASEN